MNCPHCGHGPSAWCPECVDAKRAAANVAFPDGSLDRLSKAMDEIEFGTDRCPHGVVFTSLQPCAACVIGAQEARTQDDVCPHGSRLDGYACPICEQGLRESMAEVAKIPAAAVFAMGQALARVRELARCEHPEPGRSWIRRGRHAVECAWCPGCGAVRPVSAPADWPWEAPELLTRAKALDAGYAVADRAGERAATDSTPKNDN